MPIFTVLIQHGTENSSLYSKGKKRKWSHTVWKGRNTTVPVCRWRDCLDRKSRVFKKTWIGRVNKIAEYKIDLIAALPPQRHHILVALRAFSLLVQINFYCLHLREKDSEITHPYIILAVCKRLKKKNGGKSCSIFWTLKKLHWSTHAHTGTHIAAATGSW